MDALNYSVQFVLPVCYNETDSRSDPKQSTKSRHVVAFLKVINHVWLVLVFSTVPHMEISLQSVVANVKSRQGCACSSRLDQIFSLVEYDQEGQIRRINE